MRSSWIGVVLLSLLLSGCSLFGVATKGELKQTRQEQARQQLQLRRDLQRLSDEIEKATGELARMREDLRPRVRALDENVAALEREFEDTQGRAEALGARLSELRMQVGALDSGVRSTLDSLQGQVGEVREDFGGVRAEVTAVRDSVQAVDADLAGVRRTVQTTQAQASVASRRSDHLWNLSVQELRAERARLAQRLRELEVQLRALEAEALP